MRRQRWPGVVRDDKTLCKLGGITCGSEKRMIWHLQKNREAMLFKRSPLKRACTLSQDMIFHTNTRMHTHVGGSPRCPRARGSHGGAGHRLHPVCVAMGQLPADPRGVGRCGECELEGESRHYVQVAWRWVNCLLVREVWWGEGLDGM
eukprot:351330-Chlamydomonas_euryale.AAC.4